MASPQSTRVYTRARPRALPLQQAPPRPRTSWLPDDMWRLVMQHVPLGSRAQLAVVNKQLHRVARAEDARDMRTLATKGVVGDEREAWALKRLGMHAYLSAELYTQACRDHPEWSLLPWEPRRNLAALAAFGSVEQFRAWQPGWWERIASLSLLDPYDRHCIETRRLVLQQACEWGNLDVLRTFHLRSSGVTARELVTAAIPPHVEAGDVSKTMAVLMHIYTHAAEFGYNYGFEGDTPQMQLVKFAIHCGIGLRAIRFFHSQGTVFPEDFFEYVVNHCPTECVEYLTSIGMQPADAARRTVAMRALEGRHIRRWVYLVEHGYPVDREGCVNIILQSLGDNWFRYNVLPSLLALCRQQRQVVCDEVARDEIRDAPFHLARTTIELEEWAEVVAWAETLPTNAAGLESET